VVKIFCSVPMLKNYSMVLEDIKEQIDSLNVNNYSVTYIMWGHEKDLAECNVPESSREYINVTDFKLYEVPGLMHVHDSAQKENDVSHYAYLHIKGVGHCMISGVDKVKEDRRNRIEKTFDIINTLDDIPNLDTNTPVDVYGWWIWSMGPQWRTDLKRYHVSPNFWIANVDYLKKLPVPSKENLSDKLSFLIEPGRVSKGPYTHPTKDVWRYNCENWIGCESSAVFYSSKNNQYYCAELEEKFNPEFFKTELSPVCASKFKKETSK